MIVKFKRMMTGVGHYQWNIIDTNGQNGKVASVESGKYMISFGGNTTMLEYEQKLHNHQIIDDKESFQIARGKFSDGTSFTVSQGQASDYIKFISMPFYEVITCYEQTIAWKVGFGLKGTMYLCIYKNDEICAIVEADKWHNGEQNYTLYCENDCGIETWLIYILLWDLELILTNGYESGNNLLNSGKKARKKFDPEFIKKIKNMEMSQWK